MASRDSSVRSRGRTPDPCRALALAALCAAQGASAQEALQTVTVTGSSAAIAANVAGFGDLPLSRAPFSASVITTGQLKNAGIAALGDITRLDAGATDAYNAPGYWSELAVRGFTLDNRFNYRRDGLPINAETVIHPGNKQALEILKGTSGLQAGTSAPGGLLNLVVKRPAGTVRSLQLDWTQPGTLGAALDLGDRAGPDGAVGWRVNAAYNHLEPQVHDSRGERSLLAGAFDLQLPAGSLLEAEFELSRQSEPSTPGFSLLGEHLPDAGSIDPRINLNNQSWSLPVVMAGRTASLRYTRSIDVDTNLVLHGMRQRLDSDDRIAFPYGCSSENRYDRYCSDGSFDFYDFRSSGERRTSDALDASVNGRASWLGLAHRYSAGILATRYRARFEGQAYNLVGTGTIDGHGIVPADASVPYSNTDRTERSTELHLQDAITLSPQWGLWAGLRHSRLHRASVQTNGSEANAYAQTLTTPWLAVAYTYATQDIGYLSWGRGMESEVVPNRDKYTNAGRALPALESRQIEAGFKHRGERLDWTVAAFDIHRPAASDAGVCGAAALSCTRIVDGGTRHSGVEAEAEWRTGPWNLRASATALNARRTSPTDTTIDGRRPTNVPAASVKVQAAFNVTRAPGLALLGFVTHEGRRMVLPDNSIATPGWTRLDAGVRYAQHRRTTALVWRAGIDNLTNQRAWKESPYQYGHAYLYPLAPRTLRVSLQSDF
jgi:iron complex outermembrane receptor protein